MIKLYTLILLSVLIGSTLQAQIKQISDINTAGNSGIGNPFVFNGEIYFEADNGSDIGDELYKIAADGTVTLFKNINADPEDTTPNSDPGNFIEYNGKLYFNANSGDKTGADKELWVTDGSPENTYMVMDIQPGVNKGANPQHMFVFNGQLYFQAHDGSSTQWWKYDGVSDPVKVTELNGNGFATPSWPVVDPAKNIVYFQANNGRNELHIMKSDETIEVIDINPTSHGYNGLNSTLFNGKLFFEGDNGTNGDELWISDGTEAGTKMLLDINPGPGNSDPKNFTELDGKLYFVVDDGNGDQLYVTDGTTEGTKLVISFIGYDAKVDNLFAYKGKLYFSAVDVVRGEELWVFDGSKAELIKDLNTEGDSKPEGFTIVNDLLFFEAADETGTKLWVTDGTKEKIIPVALDFANSIDPIDVNSGEFAIVGTKLFFSADDAQGDDIFMVDTKDILSRSKQASNINANANSNIDDPFVFNSEIYFEADDGTDIGDELYKIAADGTVKLFKNINVDNEDTTPNSDPGNFIEYKGKLYFNANDGDKTGNDKELWVTDGTPGNTAMVFDIQPGSNKGSNPQHMFIFNDNLYFQAHDGSSTQWWKYDGTNDPVKVTELNGNGFATPMYPVVDPVNNWVYFQANNGRNELHIMKADETVEIIDINATSHGYNGRESVIFGGKLFFEGDDGTNGDELWISNGTLAGTEMLSDINTNGNSDPNSFTELNGKLYFAADNGNGDQLFVTDGTAAGTTLVNEPFAGDDGKVDNLCAFNGKLFFSATDGANGEEIWVYDGTEAKMLKDINSEGDSDPKGFKEVDGLLFFEAADTSGTKLWVTDGTEEHTMLVAEALNTTTDPTDVDADEFAVVGTLLYYTADDEQGDDFFMVDANKLFSYNVTFEVAEENGPVANAQVTFDGATKNTDNAGRVLFPEVRMGDSLIYQVAADDYLDMDSTLNVVDGNVYETVTLTHDPNFDVTFTVTDKHGNPIVGATINFNGASQDTDENGTIEFSSIEAGERLAYTVSIDGYNAESGTVTIVDQDVTIEVTLILTGIKDVSKMDYKIYPNPTTGIIHIEGQVVNGIFKIYDVNQRLVSSGNLHTKTISVDLAPGLYFLQIENNHTKAVEKIIIK